MSNGRGNPGKKRYNSQPMEGANKDSRNDEGDQDMSWTAVVNGKKSIPTFTTNSFSLLGQPNSYPDKTMRSASICSRGSRGSGRPSAVPTRGRGSTQYQNQLAQSESSRLTDRGGRGTAHTQRRIERNPDRPTDLGENTRFVTPAPDGAMRDEIVVECKTINGLPFRGTITFKEAREVMFNEIMGFSLSDLYSVRFRYNGCPVVRLKLKQQFNLDDLMSVEFFNLERQAPNNQDIDIISCRIMGIRRAQSVPHYDGEENDIRWVKIEGTEYQLTEDEIKRGLAPFGEILTPVREDIFDFSDSEGDLVGNGTYSCKMKLIKPVPQFLPMLGKKIRIYHNGINKLCTNCFGNHTRRQCRHTKKKWIEYVRDFMMEHEHLTEEYFGRWWEAVDLEYPGYFDDPQAEQNMPDGQSQDRPTDHAKASDSQTRISQTRISRDPRINRQQPPHSEESSVRNPPQHQNMDRQTEMSKLLANGLTLTDARKYLTHMEEMETLNQRMNQQTGPRQGSHQNPGAGMPQHQQQRSERGSFRGQSLNQNMNNQ